MGAILDNVVNIERAMHLGKADPEVSWQCLQAD